MIEEKGRKMKREIARELAQRPYKEEVKFKCKQSEGRGGTRKVGGKSQCKELKAGMCFIWQRNSEKARQGRTQ